MVSYSLDEAIEKLAPVGNPWAGIHEERDIDPDEEHDG